MVKVRAFRTLENSFRRMGFNHVAGVDEVGRGCLAGPVVAAAVVASLRAMQRAVLMLAPSPDCVLVDAFRIPDLLMAQRAVIHGDSRCTAIAAASIIAKVTRDRMMQELHARDPRYGFDKHKGYATRDHLDAVARFGYSDVHRRSFRPPTLFDRMEP